MDDLERNKQAALAWGRGRRGRPVMLAWRGMIAFRMVGVKDPPRAKD